MGSEIQKTRPCLIVSPIEMNRNLNTVVVAPMTTSSKNYPTRLALEFKGKRGAAAIDQIRTVDKSGVIAVFEKISNAQIEKCKAILRETFVD